VDERIIKKESDGYHIYSEDGKKHLGGPYKSMGEAKKRLEQIDYFKNKGSNSVIYTPERRFFSPFEAELRVVEEPSGAKFIAGKAAVFNKLSQNLGGFQEKIHPKAFDKALKTADIRILRNHNPDKILGRTKAGTGEVWTEKDALMYRAKVGNTTTHRDTVEHINSGDMDGSSFSFTVDDDGDEWDEGTDPPTRTVHSIRDIFDVGPVTYPAYLDTTTGTRSEILGECRSFDAFLERRKSGLLQRGELAKVHRIRLLKMRLGLQTLERG
jgi:uncharacterized protein